MLDPNLAGIVAPRGTLPGWAETLAAASIGASSDFSALPLANDPNIYIITNHPNFERADAEQKLEALKASANQTIAAAEAIDASMLGMFRWLDDLLDHLIGVVCQRLPEGDQLRERWASDEWTIIQRLTFFDTDAALAVTRAFPAISDHSYPAPNPSNSPTRTDVRVGRSLCGPLLPEGTRSHSQINGRSSPAGSRRRGIDARADCSSPTSVSPPT